MQIKVTLGTPTSMTAPAMLLGQNLELAGDTVPGLLANRLANAKFMGPPNPMTGIAPEWQPAFTNNYHGVHFELVPGLSYSGQWSQMIHNTAGRRGVGILQIDRWVRKGERLVVCIWAMCRSRAATLSVGIRPLAAAAPVYDAATIEVNTPYWSEYTATLSAPCDDDEAVFFCTVEGLGRVYIDQIGLRPEGQELVRQDVIDEMAVLQMPVLRFPGGCVSTNYHWQLGVGEPARRPTLPDPVFKWSMDYEYGTDEYLAMCLDQGIRPQISVNVGSGTPEEARDWAAYCAAWFRKQGVEPPLMYWQIGNEHWGAWEVGNMSGEMYVDVLRAYVPGIRAAYPRARIIALGPETGEVLDPDERLPWRAPVLDKAADLVDLIAVQHYGRTWSDDPGERLAGALDSARELLRLLAEAGQDCRERALDVRVAVTEWNLWRRASHYDERGFLEPYDALHALYVASALNGFVCLQPDLELANFYHLLNPMGLFISRGPDVQRMTTVDVFKLYRPAFPGRVVPCHLDTSGPVDVVALANDSGAWLFAVNSSLDQSVELVVDGLGGEVESVQLTAAALQDDLEAGPARIAGDRCQLPPLSITRLRATRPRVE